MSVSVWSSHFSNAIWELSTKTWFRKAGTVIFVQHAWYGWHKVQAKVRSFILFDSCRQNCSVFVLLATEMAVQTVMLQVSRYPGWIQLIQ